MKVESILKAKGSRVVTAPHDTRISALARRLKLERVGAIVISEDGERVNGLVSERDIVHGLAERGIELLDLTAADIMVREVATCRREDPLDRVMARMTHGRLRHLPVIEDGRLCGIVSIGDIVKNRLEELELERTVLRDAYMAGR